MLSSGDLVYSLCFCFFFQAEDGIRDLVRSRGLGDVYKRQDSVPNATSLVERFSVVMKRLDDVLALPSSPDPILSLIHI